MCTLNSIKHEWRFIMKFKLLILLFTVLLISYGSSSLAQPLPVERLSVAEGLSNPRVHKVYQDSYGLLWISTFDGLNLYDGYSFKIFKNIPGNSNSLQNNFVYWVTEDADKNIWVATEEGVSRFVRGKNEFVNYDFKSMSGSTNDNAGDAFQILVDSKNNVWASTRTFGALLFNRETNSWEEQSYLIDDSVQTNVQDNLTLLMIEDYNHILWLSSMRLGLLFYDEVNKVFKEAEFAPGNNLPDFSKTNHAITSMYGDLSEHYGLPQDQVFINIILKLKN